MKRFIWLVVFLFLMGVSAGGNALAYPDKPVNMIIAFTAGGSSDVQARIMQKYWDKYAPKPWVFVYKPGAGGIIGFTEIANARKDGYTIGGLNLDEFRILNVAAEKRNDFLPKVPTLREDGIDIVSDIRRLFAAPKGVNPAILKELRAIFKKICEDPEYLADMKKAGQPAEYLDADALKAYIDKQDGIIKTYLQEEGLLKRK